MRDKIERWYKMGLWSADMVRNAAGKGVISEKDADEIVKAE